MSENNEYGEMTPQQIEALKRIQEQAKEQANRKEKLDLSVTVEQKETLAQKFGSEMLEKLKKRCIEANVDFGEPKTIEDVQALISASQQAERGKEGIEPSSGRYGGAGQLPLSRAKGSQKDENEGYESVEDMIDDVRRMAKSKNKGEAMHGKELLDMFFTKFAKGLKKANQEIGYESTGGVEEFVKKQNEEYRKKFMQGEKDE